MQICTNIQKHSHTKHRPKHARTHACMLNTDAHVHALTMPATGLPLALHALMILSVSSKHRACADRGVSACQSDGLIHVSLMI